MAYGNGRKGEERWHINLTIFQIVRQIATYDGQGQWRGGAMQMVANGIGKSCVSHQYSKRTLLYVFVC
jgi:hypothetical protein